jgi:PAS domain S-box-containing protein
MRIHTGNGASERFFRQMMDALPLAVLATDGQGRLTYFNAAAEKLSGRRLQIGTQRWCSSWKLYRCDGTPLPESECPLAAALRTGRTGKTTEIMAERPDGSRFRFTPHPGILRNVKGRITGAINVLTNITEQRAARDESAERFRANFEAAPDCVNVAAPDGTLLLQMNLAGLSMADAAVTGGSGARKRAEADSQLLRAIVDCSADAIVSKDLGGMITSWNTGAEHLFGYTAAEVLGRPITILTVPDRMEEEAGILARLKRGERIDHFETIRRTKNGRLVDISLTVSPVKDASGTVVGASSICRDITGRKRAEAALLASEERFRQLADSLPQIVWTARVDGRLDYCNERWYEFTGFERGTTGDVSWEPILHPDDMERSHEAWNKASASGEPYEIEYRFWDRWQHRWRWFMARAVPVRDAEANLKWFGTCTDIDEQKHSEDELRRANEDLEQFAFSASHDLREPLRSVKIYAELLTRRYGNQLDGDALKYLGFLRSAATRLDMLVHDLVAYTEVTQIEPPPEIADANAALSAALASLSSLISGSGAEVAAAPLPCLHVHPTHLQQIFQNLIGNAIKYRKPGEPPRVRINAKRQSGQWVFSVSDNGIGIQPEYKEKIFGLFKRLHTSEHYPGTGIGLAICKRIVDRYHGRIWVDSEPGEGTSFHFALPA